MSLMKQQFVVTHTVRQTGIPALFDSWVTHTHTFCQNLVSTKKLFLLIFSWNHDVLKCWSLKDLSVFLSAVKLRIGRLHQIAVSWAIYGYTHKPTIEILPQKLKLLALTEWPSGSSSGFLFSGEFVRVMWNLKNVPSCSTDLCTSNHPQSK
jgi:hypothetical protein